MKLATREKQMVKGYVVSWVLAVVFMFLFVPGAFNWFQTPLVLGLTIAVGAAIRVAFFRRRQRRQTPA